jgi:hypothetical protein
MQRHGRQIALTEIGVAGQARIEASHASVRLEGPAADVAVRYLAGAGVRRLLVREARLVAIAQAVDESVVVDVDPGLPLEAGGNVLGLSDDASLELARGAYGALVALRTAIGLHS